MSDVSVIIPTLNEAKHVGQCIDAATLAGACEIIVADGGSTDGTVDIARDRGAMVLTGPAGRAVQQNMGSSHASGEILLFVHADCLLSRQCIRQIIDLHQQDDRAHGAFRQSIEGSGFLFRWLELGNALRVRVLGIPYGDQGIFISTHRFREVGGFPAIQIMEDLVLMRTLRRRKFPRLLPGPISVSARRWKKHGIVRQTFRNWGLVLAWMCGKSPDELSHQYPLCNESTMFPSVEYVESLE